MARARIRGLRQITSEREDVLQGTIYSGFNSDWTFLASNISRRESYLISSPYRFSWRPSQGGDEFDPFAGGRLSKDIEELLCYPHRGMVFVEIGANRYLDCGTVHYASCGLEPRLSGWKTYWIYFHLDRPIDFDTWNSVVQRTRWSAVVNDAALGIEDAAEFPAIWARFSSSEVIDVRLTSYSWDVHVVINGKHAAILKDAERWAPDVEMTEEEWEAFVQKVYSTDFFHIFDYSGHNYEFFPENIMGRDAAYEFIHDVLTRNERPPWTTEGDSPIRKFHPGHGGKDPPGAAVPDPHRIQVVPGAELTQPVEVKSPLLDEVVEMT